MKQVTKRTPLIILIIVLLVLSVSVIYLQLEVENLKSSKASPTPELTPSETPSASPTPTPTPALNQTPQPTQSPTNTLPSMTPTPQVIVTPLASSSTTKTYGGTTLVCTGSLLMDVDGGSVFYINYINITNVGTATAYGVSLEVLAYYPNGTLGADVTKVPDASGIYGMIGFVPANITSGETLSLPNSGRPGASQIRGLTTYDTSILGNYTIIPFWSSTP